MHTHPHTLEPTHGASVVVDIGDDVGALVLYATAAEHGDEIDVEPVARPGQRTHVAVRARHVGGHTTYAALYPALAAGDHVVHLPAGARRVTVAAGRVTEVSLADLVG